MERVIDRLISFQQSVKDIIGGQNKFEAYIGLSTGYISNMKKNNGGISSDVILKLKNKFSDLNLDWLITGEGPMFKSEASAKKTSYSINKNVIKYYPAVSGSMGGVQFLDDPEESYVDIILPGFSECKYAINAYGDSMHPVIKSGQVVILMEWMESFIDWGRIYLVVTKSGYRIIKYLKPSDNADAIRCESENKELNPAFDINKEDIHKLFLVKGWVCRDTI